MTSHPDPAKPETKPNAVPKRQDNNAAWDAPDDAVPQLHHHRDEVRDLGVLDSIGRAITDAVLPQPEHPPAPTVDQPPVKR